MNYKLLKNKLLKNSSCDFIKNSILIEAENGCWLLIDYLLGEDSEDWGSLL